VSHALEASGAVELAVLERSGIIESRHLGAAAVMSGGAVVRALGDIDALIYPRSTLKFVQAVTVLRAGVELTGEALVLAAASHPGTPEHVRVVTGMLASADLDESALQCPADWPGDPSSRRIATERSRLTMNCSGKHAAFLLACIRNGRSTADYLDPGHPLQQRIRNTVEEFAAEPVGHTGVDGCGAPVFAITLRGLVTAIAHVADGTDPHATRLVSAIREHPWALDSAAITTVMTELGVIAKNGAEGVFVAAAADGAAVALKILDGSTRVSIPVALSLLGDRVDPDAVRRVLEATTEPVLGAGFPVGRIASSV
jgi:L-asparaginase II